MDILVRPASPASAVRYLCEYPTRKPTHLPTPLLRDMRRTAQRVNYLLYLSYATRCGEQPKAEHREDITQEA